MKKAGTSGIVETGHEKISGSKIGVLAAPIQAIVILAGRFAGNPFPMNFPKSSPMLQTELDADTLALALHLGGKMKLFSHRGEQCCFQPQNSELSFQLNRRKCIALRGCWRFGLGLGMGGPEFLKLSQHQPTRNLHHHSEISLYQQAAYWTPRYPLAPTKSMKKAALAHFFDNCGRPTGIKSQSAVL